LWLTCFRNEDRILAVTTVAPYAVLRLSPTLGHGIAHNSSKPRSEAATRTVVLEHFSMLKNRQHYLLNNVLGRMVGTAAPPGKVED
jgi:hypothetical protein